MERQKEREREGIETDREGRERHTHTHTKDFVHTRRILSPIFLFVCVPVFSCSVYVSLRMSVYMCLAACISFVFCDSMFLCSAGSLLTDCLFAFACLSVCVMVCL